MQLRQNQTQSWNGSSQNLSIPESESLQGCLSLLSSCSTQNLQATYNSGKTFIWSMQGAQTDQLRSIKEDNCLSSEISLITQSNYNINFHSCHLKGWYVKSHENFVPNKGYWVCIDILVKASSRAVSIYRDINITTYIAPSLLIVLVSLSFSIAKVFRRSSFVISHFYQLVRNPQLFFSCGNISIAPLLV